MAKKAKVNRSQLVRDLLQSNPGMEPRDIVEALAKDGHKISWKDLGEIKITDAHAVVNITKEDADAFCYWLSHREKKDYRLPTEAEWEYACRGGTTTIWHFGNDPAVGKGFGNVGLKNFTMFPAPAGSFKPNAFGLLDMYGGASECVQDGYAPYSTERVVDPVAKKGQHMLARGGMWSWGPEWCRSSMRIRIPDARWGLSHSGFRVVMAGDLTRQR